MVLPVLSIPVPPFAPKTMPVTLAADPDEMALVTKSFTALLLGYLSSASMAETKPAVNVKFALSCFKSKAVCVAELTGLLASDVLSTLPKPTSAFTMPLGATIVLLVKVSMPAKVAIVPEIGKVTFVAACAFNVVG